MRKPYVFVGKPIPQHVEAYIGEHCDYNIWNHEEKIPREQLKKELEKAEGAIVPKVNIDNELLAGNEHLKVVCTVAVGYDNFDVNALKRHGILATHTPYVLDETVADLMFGLIISGMRRIPELHVFTQKGRWEKLDDDHFLGKDVHHSTLGIIGMGRIGEHIVKRAVRGFDMNVIYHNRSSRPELEKEYGVKKVHLNELLQNADIVLMMAPLSKETYHIISKAEIEQMKPSALLINGGRGPTIDEQALIDALKEKRIFGAALDVYEQEPLDKFNELLKLDNVTLTPHIGSATLETREAMAMRAAKNLVEVVKGNNPIDLIKELK